MHHPTAPPTRRAFSLLELLVALGVVFLLMSLIFVALRGVTQGAQRADSSNALRQMGTAYIAYAGDHRQTLLPGYLSNARQATFGIDPKLDDGTRLNSPNDAASYLWRLAAYVDFDWRVMMTDYDSAELTSQLSEMLANGDRSLSRWPSFGLNAYYLGGDDVHGGVLAGRNPWDDPTGSPTATRLSEVKNPARIVVFVPTVHSNDGIPPGATPISDLRYGAPVVRAPYARFDDTAGQWVERQWQPSAVAGPAGGVEASAGATWSAANYDGWPIDRWGDALPAVHLDGSVTTHAIADFATDMRLWSPDAGPIRRAVSN